MSDEWNLLPWEYVCDQSPGVRTALEDANFHAEYGMNFYEFIQTTEGLEKHIQAWWDSLSTEDKYDQLADRLEHIESLRARVIEAINKIR